jgi:hypothetical protein
MMTDARRGRFDVVLVWACDRIARSTRHFLDVLDDLNRIGVEFVSFMEQIDTGGPLGRAIVIIIGAIAELECNLIIERVRAGMRRARLEGQHIGRNPLQLDNAAIQRDRQQGQSLRQIAKGHRISTATVQRVLREHAPTAQEQAAFLVLLVCLAVIVVLAALLYAAGRGYLSALAGMGKLSATLSQVLADTQLIELSLRQQRRVLYDAHKRISAVTKGV